MRAEKQVSQTFDAVFVSVTTLSWRVLLCNSGNDRVSEVEGGAGFLLRLSNSPSPADAERAERDLLERTVVLASTLRGGH